MLCEIILINIAPRYRIAASPHLPIAVSPRRRVAASRLTFYFLSSGVSMTLHQSK
jgi:hypothetical protein